MDLLVCEAFHLMFHHDVAGADLDVSYKHFHRLPPCRIFAALPPQFQLANVDQLVKDFSQILYFQLESLNCNLHLYHRFLGQPSSVEMAVYQKNGYEAPV